MTNQIFIFCHVSPYLTLLVYFSCLFVLKSYQWLKDKIVSDDGRKQQAKLKELGHIAEKLGCTLTQLAVGKNYPIDTFTELPY